MRLGASLGRARAATLRANQRRGHETPMLRGVRGRAFLLLAGAGCQRTAEGIQQDTLSAKASAEKSAEDAKRTLDRQVGDFKTQAGAQLEKLTQQVDPWTTQAQGNLEGSKQKLEGQLHE